MTTRPLVPSHIETLPKYQAGMSPVTLKETLGIDNGVKLSSNENDIGPSPRVKEALHKAIEELHRYPLPSGGELRRALLQHYNLPTEQILLGNGSDEIIDLALRALTLPGDVMVGSEATFFRYRIAAQAQGLTFKAAPLKNGYEHDLQAIAALANQSDARVVVLVNPSNPTGTWFTQQELEDFFEAIDDHRIVIVDEAYVEYATHPDFPSSLAFLASRPNTIIQRTFSKAYGLAACRVGYAFSSAALVDAMERVRAPFSVNTLAQVSAAAALLDTDHLRTIVQHNHDERERITQALTALGLHVIPSQTNFVLIDVGRDGLSVYEALLQAGIIVRPVIPYGFKRHIRVTLSTREANDRFLSAITAIVQ